MLFNTQVLISCLLTTLTLFPGASASSNHGRGLVKVHQKHKPTVESPSNSTQELEKRQRRIAHFSWYDTEESGNPGHCGDHIRNSEFVVARKYSEFTMADCGKQIRIFYKGKTAVATIKDSCPGCWDGGFDMSRGLFQFFEWDAWRVGVFDTEYEWVGAAAPAPPPPPPTTTSRWTPPPTPSSTSVWRPPPTPSSSSVRSSSRTSSSSRSARPSSSGSTRPTASASASVSGTARPTSSASPDNNAQQENLAGLSSLFVKMAVLVTDGRQASA